MTANNSATVSVEGRAVIRVKPSDFILIGSVTGEGSTLQNALDELEEKRAQVEPWLLGIGNATIEFGAARLPEQTDPSIYQSPMTRGMPNLHGPEPEVRTRKVFQAYLAVWSIENMSSNEILIFSDRMRFETQDKNIEEDPQDSATDLNEFDPQMLHKQLLSRMEPNREENREAHFLFRARLPKKEFETGVAIACEDAMANAKLLAAGVGRKVGNLRSVSGHSIGRIDQIQNDMHRSNQHPMLNEVDLTADEWVSLSENPKPARFTISFHASYELI